MKDYMTRQQIRAINKRLYAYEFLSDSEDTTEFILTNMLTNNDFEDNISGIPVLVRLDSKYINDKDKLDTIELIDKDSILLQVENSDLNSLDNIDMLLRLKESGYIFIVSITSEDNKFDRAESLTNIIKFSVNDIPDVVRGMGSADESDIKLIISDINNRTSFITAEKLNIDYYEGTYISVDENVSMDSSRHSQVNFIEVMNALFAEEPDLKDIAEVIKRDALLSSQLVKLANSAYYAARVKTEDVKSAVIRVGIKNLKRWILLIQFSKISFEYEEILKHSYMRALLAEEITKKSKSVDLTPDTAYMIGLFSTMGSLTGKTLEQAIAAMQLSEEIEDAIIYKEGDGGMILNLITAYEEADWKYVDKYIKRLGIDKEELYKFYFKSIDNVNNLWKGIK